MTAWEKQIAGRLTGWLGNEFRYLKEIDSTNQYVQAHLAELPHGAVVLADYQSAGRGRLGRSWQAPPRSSLLVSILVRPNWPAARAGWLTMITGLAVVEAIEAVTGLDVALKWPNDVVRERAGRPVKLGGILIEGELDETRLATAVIGVGLNVNLTREELPSARVTPSSLLLETGRPIDRPALLVTLLAGLEQWIERCDAGQNPRPLWAERLITLGREVTVQEIDEQAVPWQGVAERIDDEGRLLIRDREGELRTVSAADVTLKLA